MIAHRLSSYAEGNERRVRLGATAPADSVHLVEACEGHGLPHVSLHGLAVAHEDVGAVRGLVQHLAAVGHAAPNAQALEGGTASLCTLGSNICIYAFLTHLSKGPGGDVDKVQPGRGVALEVALQLAELQQLAGGEKARLGPSGVEDGGGVTLGQDEAIVGGSAGIVQVVPGEKDNVGVAKNEALRINYTIAAEQIVVLLKVKLCAIIKKEFHADTCFLSY